ncbi:hypothetical protein ACQKMD_18905 [Viridibacillus sp. NPDC096237]|uniref:hypothetical protein n=1 Tax=Viridibacillus sp. NPDC096237 TaxID=3390721 RepID=UPI003D081A32
MFKENLTKKKVGFFSIFMVLLCLIAGILAFSFNIYPGGYSLKENSEEATVIKKNFFEKEKHAFEITEENELKIALIKNDVKQLFTIWLVSLLVISSLLIILVNNVHRKGNVAFFLPSILLILLIPLDIYVYIDNLDHIEQLIRNLKI